MRIGVIEWMQNTQTLKEIICDTMDKEQRQRYGAVMEEHNQWAKRYSNQNKSVAAWYQNVMKEGSITDVMTQLHKMQALIEPFLLRDALKALSASTEAYLSARQHFGRTISTMNVCQYLVGIGDRHASNILIDRKRCVAEGCVDLFPAATSACTPQTSDVCMHACKFAVSFRAWRRQLLCFRSLLISVAAVEASASISGMRLALPRRICMCLSWCRFGSHGELEVMVLRARSHALLQA